MRVLLSKSVAQLGKSLFLYHGSNSVFDTFSLDYSVEGAIFLTSSKVRAKRFGKVLYTVEVTYGDMFVIDGKKIPEEHSVEDIERVIASAESRKCDLVLIKGFRDYGVVGDTYIALDPKRIKIKHRSK